MSSEIEIAYWAAVGQVGAAVLAAIALIISIITAWAQMNTAKELAREQSESSAALARDHQALLVEQVAIQRDSDILRWTEQVIDVLSDADSFAVELGAAPFDDLARSRRRRLQSRLSALIDHGRMYFPNEREEAKGAGNPRAYRGHRQVILDALVFAYDALNEAHAVNGDAEARALCAKLVECRRQFVSEAQAAINPQRFIEMREMNKLRTARGLSQAPQQIANNGDLRSGASAPQQVAR